MISPVMPVAALAGAVQVADIRHRPGAGERPIMADSAPPTAGAPSASNGGQFPKREQQSLPDEAPARDRSASFAAAVLSGALPPRPQTMDELFRRIGTSTIPEESQARLKDLLV